MKRSKKYGTAAVPQVKDTKPNYFNIPSIALIIIIGIAIYSNTFHSSFQFDDNKCIIVNPDIKDLSDLRAIFNYMPTRFITDLSLAVNYHFGRFDVFGYHLFNLLVHISAALMVWWLVILTLQTPALKDSRISGHSGIIAFFAALIFISHPVQTQGVTYIIQRAASLGTLFYISSLALYVRSRLLRHEEGKSRIRSSCYALSFIALVLAMFSKEMTITLPFMILLYELFFFKEDGIGWKRVMPFFAALAIIPITMMATGSVNFEEMRLESESGPSIIPSDYLLTQFRVIVTYIRLLFIPVNQNLDYDYPISRTLFDIPTLSSLILLVIILIAAVKLFRRYRLVSFGIFWFFLTLLPESSIIPIQDVIFEHRLYLPMAGYAIFLVSAVYYIFENKGMKPVIAILSVIAISYSILTYSRNFVWKDGVTLWADTLRKSPNKARTLNNRGDTCQGKGDPDQAIYYYNKAVELDPKYALAFKNRGDAYTKKADPDRAISDYSKAIEIYPGYADAYNGRGNAYLDKADLARAISDYNKTIELNPEYAAAFNNRGIAYIEKGDPDRAISDCIKAIELNHEYGNAYYSLSAAYFKKGQYDKSWEAVHKAEALGRKADPGFIEALKKMSGREE